MAKRNSLNTVKRTTSTKKSELTKKVTAATKKKTTTTKKTATKNTPLKKTTTTTKKTTRTRVSKVNDDALKTMINIPVVDEKEINRSKKKTVLKEYDILYAFYWTKTDRNYIIYTDNSVHIGNENIIEKADGIL